MPTRAISAIRAAHIYLVIALVLHLTFDPLFGFEDALDRHVRVQITRALYLTLIPFLGTLTFLLYSFPLHSHRQAFLIAAVLAPVALPFINDARLLLATSV